MKKPVCGPRDAVREIPDGATVMLGGFGGAGAPVELIHALLDHGARELTVVNNNAGNGDVGLAALIRERRVRKMICSFPRSSDPRAFQELYLAGEIQLELVPQGTLAERIRAGGAGIPAFFTRTSVGTPLAEGKETQQFEGKTYVMERWLKSDFALVKAHRADRHGNLVYRDSARNFNPLAAMCGRVTIAEVEELVEPGELDPNHVHTPGVFVQRVVALTPEQAADKRIEKRTVRPRGES